MGHDPRRKWKIGIIVGVIIAAILAAGATGYYFWHKHQTKTASTISASTGNTITSAGNFQQTGTLAGDKATGFRLIYTKDGQPSTALLTFVATSKCVISWEMTCEEALTKESFGAGDLATVEGTAQQPVTDNAKVTVIKLTAQKDTGTATPDANSVSATSSPTQGDENTPATVACTAQDYAMDEASCASQTPEKVCGTIRYVYDGGQEQFHDSTSDNVCSYCSQFDADGFLELRGTKMYSMGYKMGACQ